MRYDKFDVPRRLQSLDHIVHHLLSLWPTGAFPNELQAGYDLNKEYKRKQYSDDVGPVDLSDPQAFKECLGKPEYYHDFLKLFQKKIEDHGVQVVLQEYLFNRDERADNILARLHSGFMPA